MTERTARIYISATTGLIDLRVTPLERKEWYRDFHLWAARRVMAGEATLLREFYDWKLVPAVTGGAADARRVAILNLATDGLPVHVRQNAVPDRWLK